MFELVNSVGAALLTEDGKIFTGCNVENIAYGESICAEKTAVVKAVSDGHRKFIAIAVATRNGASPCGSCRQILYEFSPTMTVFIVNEDKGVKEIPLSELLPHAVLPNL